MSLCHHERAVKSRLLPYSAYVAEGSLAGSLGAPSVCACRMRSASSLRRWRSRSLRSSSFLSLYACQTCLIFPCAHAERSLHSRLSRSVSYCRILCRAFRASIPYQPIFIPSVTTKTRRFNPAFFLLAPQAKRHIKAPCCPRRTSFSVKPPAADIRHAAFLRAVALSCRTLVMNPCRAPASLKRCKRNNFR